MKLSRTSCPCPSSRESIRGGLYLAFQMLFLPTVLFSLNDRLSVPLNSAELNFVYYLINFLAIAFLFHDFLGASLRKLWQHPIEALQAAVLGFAAYWASFTLLQWLIGLLMPGYTNYNDASIAAMTRDNYLLMFVGTVILVPPAEECLYRGLIFRNLYSKSKWAAYVISVLAFSCIHILGYVGTYSPAQLLIAVSQYLPAGIWLAWSAVKGNTIFVPIVIHAAVNFFTISGFR